MHLLEHKGYETIVHISFDDNILYGRVMFIEDLVTYEAETPQGAKQAFEDAVDDYLAFCVAHNKEPEKPEVSLRSVL